MIHHSISFNTNMWLFLQLNLWIFMQSGAEASESDRRIDRGESEAATNTHRGF
ncbi:hypothetical protein GW17_00002025 [Ensete ventricosum]|nr:hypothetical protein GW17_00002025 [Ensete ventricosum]RZS02137.1 hypothetical protein BHM03_00032139 [Ensete ventricosum]